MRKKSYYILSNQRLNAQLEFLKIKFGMHSKAQLISEVIEPLFQIVDPNTIPLKLTASSENDSVILKVTPKPALIWSGKLTATIQDTLGHGFSKRRGIHD